MLAKIKKSKVASITISVILYISAFYLAYFLIPNSVNSIWLKVLIWHVISTIFIYFFSVALKNSSLYDPFWSVAPIPIVLYLMAYFDQSFILNFLVVMPIIIWSFRLTFNFLINWDGFVHEDFRYVDLKNTNYVKAEIINLFGIHLIPTLIVNLSLYPIIYIFTSNEVNYGLLFFASMFTILAVILETVADYQMREFKKDTNNAKKTMKYGLWKYSRHPNYFGEALFWFGIYFMGLSSAIMPLWLIVCPIIMLMLFVFISCPLMDARSLKKRDDYKDYMATTSQLLILPKK
ncbi:MAG: hypothetical protein CMD80_03985 [Gammaproteobacteria bacterium]|nr:hypothetical protein [Gammaproteobacteria bacterium]